MKSRTKIFLTLFLTYAFFTNTYLTTNDASRFSLTAAIVEEHSFKIDGFLENVISEQWLPLDKAKFRGDTYSDKAPLGSFLGVPIYFILKYFNSDLEWTIYFVSLLTTGLLTALTAVLIYETGRHFTVDEEVRIRVALAFGLGSIALVYGTAFFSHAITSFFGFASFFLLFQIRHRKLSLGYLMAAGVFAALAISSDYYAGILAIALVGYSVVTVGKKTYLFLIPFFAVIILLMTYHWAAFESPLAVPYLYSNLFDNYHSTGFYGMRIPDSEFISRLKSNLFSRWGFFFTTPLAALALIAFPKFKKRFKEEAAVFLAVAVGLIYVIGVLGFFDAYSTRHLVPLVPFLFMLLYTLDFKDSRIKTSFYILTALSLIINFVGVDRFILDIDDSLIGATYGTHNLAGQFLMDQGINVHFLSLLPLFVFYGFIWRHEILHWAKPVSS